MDQIPMGGGAKADLFLLRFDKHGRLLSPKTAVRAIVAASQATDVFLFSHGWNNVYAEALDRYRDFATGFVRQRAELNLPAPPGYRPVLIGIVWPATWFVLPWEQGPDIAGGAPGGPADIDGSPSGTDAATSPEQTEQMLAEVTDTLSEADAAVLVELVDGSAQMSDRAARDAAEIVRKGLWPDDEDGMSERPDLAAVLASWQAISSAGNADEDEEDEEVGTVDPQPGSGTDTDDPDAAGSMGLDPRDLLRLGSVWKMKARAGKVGTDGVAPLLARLLNETKARVHLVGHSFGARVVLSAVAAQGEGRDVRSMLLLQPAVNRWCFAKNVARTGRVGGYAAVIDRVEQPILTTLSRSDKPLNEFFHLAVRGDSLGEVDTAAVGDTDRYGALGGYGPAGLDTGARTEFIRAPGNRYDLGGPEEVLAIDGSVAAVEADAPDDAPPGGPPAVPGHGDISNSATWWALHCLVAP